MAIDAVPPAFTSPTPEVREELEPKCWPVVNGRRIDLCPWTKEWFSRLMKLDLQLSAKDGAIEEGQ